MPTRTNRLGFTLIELLVVIAMYPRHSASMHTGYMVVDFGDGSTQVTTMGVNSTFGNPPSTIFYALLTPAGGEVPPANGW